MQAAHPPLSWTRPAACRGLAFCLLAVLVTAGCARHKNTPANPPGPPTVQLVPPQTRKLVRVVGQPSFVEAYERTSIYPKVTGYIEKWIVDIGDKVKKGDVLAKLFVPELVEDWGTKKATVKLQEQRIALALQLVQVADADVHAAEARLAEAKAILAKYQSEADRWDSEVKRLRREVNNGVVDPQVLLESENQWKSSLAARDAARATILTMESDLLSKKATLAKDKVDVDVVRADLVVAQSEARRLEAWVGYLTLAAPYDGIVVARNANTWDFVLPSMGDPTADPNAPHLAPGGRAAPIYVVDRIDIVRVFIDIPEQDANYVQVGTRASVQIKGYRDQWLPATVTRTSWALNVKSRTLRAEIDLPNSGSQILPGMYAYGKVIIERPHVWALPLSALAYSGDKVYYWSYEDGRAARTEVQTGVSDGEWIEVTNRRPATPSSGEDGWTPIDGSEQAILGDLAGLAEGGRVKVAPGSAEVKSTDQAGASK
jgi:HlyD family secretion protein